MKRFQALALVALLTVGLAPSAFAYSFFEVTADSTMAGQAGFLLSIADSSEYYDVGNSVWVPFLDVNTIFVTEEAGHLRFVAARPADTTVWTMFPPGSFVAPPVGAVPGDTWTTLPDDLDRLNFSTFHEFQSTTVPVGTFSTAVCIQRPLPPADPGPSISELRYFAFGVGLVQELWPSDEWADVLASYSLVGGSGYWPMAVGNWWQYDGQDTAIDPVSGTDNTPLAINLLHGNYPNPFNPSTEISFEMATAGSARLAVYDMAGRLVRMLVDGQRSAGRQSVSWNGRDDAGRSAAAGVYLYRFEAGKSVQTRSMTLVK